MPLDGGARKVIIQSILSALLVILIVAISAIFYFLSIIIDPSLT